MLCLTGSGIVMVGAVKKSASWGWIWPIADSTINSAVESIAAVIW